MSHTKRTFTIALFCIIALLLSYIPVNAASKNNTKEKYYKEYQKIIKAANKKLGRDDFTLLPINKIKKKNMLSLKDFKDSVNALMIAEKQEAILEDDNSQEVAPKLQGRASGETVSSTKSHTYKVGNVSVKISCNATFVTRYNSSSKRRFITSIKNNSSKVSGSGYHWKATPTVSASVIDGGRTGYIRYTGVVTNSSGYSKKVAPTYNFYCNSGGGIE